MSKIHLVNDQYQFAKWVVKSLVIDSCMVYIPLMMWAWYCDLDLVQYHTTLSVMFLMTLAWVYFEIGASAKRVLGRKYQSPMLVPFLMYCEKMYDPSSTVIQQGIVDELEEMDYDEFKTVELQSQFIAFLVAIGLTFVLFLPVMIKGFI